MNHSLWKFCLALFAIVACACSDSDSSAESADSAVLVDQRDMQGYKIMEIGSRIWMAENLNYYEKLENNVVDSLRISSWCYNDSAIYCEKQGRLYEWNAAMTACPDEWELPSKADFDSLFASVGGFANAADSLMSRGFIPQINGGYYYMGYYSFFDKYAYFWTSDEVRTNNARSVMFEEGRSGTSFDETYEAFGLSVRCVKKQ